MIKSAADLQDVQDLTPARILAFLIDQSIDCPLGGLIEVSAGM
jgi:hypothetical protein